MTKSPHSFDISIIGAGVVGITAAIALAQNGHKVALLAEYDLTKSHKNNDPLDVRSIALSLSSKQILKHLGCWQDLQNHCRNIHDIEVSSQGHWGVTRLNHQQQNCDALGYVIESHHLESILIQKLECFKNINVFHSSQYTQLVQTEDGCNITLKHKNKSINVNSHVCFICDGAQSKARDMAGFKTKKYDYHQMAIATNVSGAHMQNNIAYERFSPHGPLAMLPLTQSRYGLVWSNSAKHCQQLMAMTDNDFLKALQHNFGHRLGRITQTGKRFAFPLIKLVTETLVQQRCVVLGNAAHNLHPVAGQSLNLALRDIAHLADFLSDLTNASEHLEHYQQLRQADHKQVIELGDTLVHLFSNNLPVLNHARSAALALLDIVPTLKNNVAWRGMGFAQTPASAQRG